MNPLDNNSASLVRSAPALGMYIQNGDLYVSPDQYGLNLITQWGEQHIPARYVKALDLDHVGNSNAGIVSAYGVRFLRSTSGMVLLVEGGDIDEYRMSMADATSLVDFIRKISKEMWKQDLH